MIKGTINSYELWQSRPENLNEDMEDPIESAENRGWNQCNRRWIKTIDEMLRVGEWIPCGERLPEDESIMYWTTHEDGSLVMHGYTKKNGFIYNWEVDDLEKRKRQGSVIAWMPLPLPEPYEEANYK